MANFLES